MRTYRSIKLNHYIYLSAFLISDHVDITLSNNRLVNDKVIPTSSIQLNRTSDCPQKPRIYHNPPTPNYPRHSLKDKAANPDTSFLRASPGSNHTSAFHPAFPPQVHPRIRSHPFAIFPCQSVPSQYTRADPQRQ